MLPVLLPATPEVCMELKASSVYDYKAMKALVYIGLYKKRNPNRSYWFITIVAIALIAIFILFRDLLLDSKFEITLVALLAFFALMNSFFHFFLPVISFRAMKKMAGIKVNFLFTDDSMSVHSESDLFEANSTIKYEVLLKAMETKARLFLFQTKSQAYVIDKSTIEAGSAEDLKNVLMPILGKKYIVCKY